MDMKTLQVWTDGGARGNPGPAGIGVHIVTLGKVMADLSEYVGIKTNNQAEYLALTIGLQWLTAHFDPSTVALELFTDSELLAYQIQGRYKVKNHDLRLLYDQAKQALEALSNHTITPIRREKNQIADRLVNEAIDAETEKKAEKI